MTGGDGGQAVQRALRLWRVFQTHRYADVWYGAREAGETLRRWALASLSTNRMNPGGAHPDARESSSFSAAAVLGAAAHELNLTIWKVADPPSMPATPSMPALPATLLDPHAGPVAWLMTYPGTRSPELATCKTPLERAAEQRFAIACMLGFACKERRRLEDPDAPAGIILPPQDPAIVSVLHQFAIGLLALARDCPDSWTCACNDIRARYNAPPPDHEQPTDALSLAELRLHLPPSKGHLP